MNTDDVKLILANQVAIMSGLSALVSPARREDTVGAVRRQSLIAQIGISAKRIADIEKAVLLLPTEPSPGSHREKSLTPWITNETHGFPPRNLLNRVRFLISKVSVWSEWPDEADIGPTLIAVEKFLSEGKYP